MHSRRWYRRTSCLAVGLGLAMGCSHSQHCATCSGARLVAQPSPCATVVVNPHPDGQPIVLLPQDAGPAREAVPASYNLAGTGTGEDPIRRRSYADITASPQFAHAPDYTWLVGELQYLHSHKCWRIRYASVDDDDRFGGGLMLVTAGAMADYKDGQLVRVEGEIVDPDAAEPTFHVRDIHALPHF